MKRFLSLLLTAMMIFSCVSFTASAEQNLETETPAPVFELFTGNKGITTESPNAIAGTKILLTVPGEDAVYYNNGTEIATTAGAATGTVAAAVNAGVNKFTAVAGGTTYGPVTIYGYTPVNDGVVVGADIGKSAADDKKIVGTDAVLIEENPAELTNLIDDNHSFAYKAGTDSTVKYKWSSGMATKSHYAAAVGFYVDGTLAEGVYEERPIEPAPTDPELPTTEVVELVAPETFRVFNFQASGDNYLGVFVGPQNHLYIRSYGQSGYGDDTGVVITPNVWHDLGVAVTWNLDTIASIYLDGQLVAKTQVKPASYIKAGTIPNRTFHYPAVCAAGKGYIGEPVTAPVFAEYPVVTSRSKGTTARIAINRGETIDLPSATVAKEAEDNTVSFTSHIPAELAGAEAKILVNGAVANTMANGDKVVILSDVALENATVTAAIVDALGNVLTGIKGELLTSEPITMNINVQGVEPLMGDVTFYDVVGGGFETRPYAVAGNKVVVVPPSVVNFNEGTQHIAYFSGETDVTASTVAGPFEGTVAVPVVADSDYITAKVLDTATGAVLAETNTIELYAQTLTEGTEINAFTAKSTAFTNVTDTLTADLASEDSAVKAKAEALLEGGRTVYQTKATAANNGAQITSFVTGAAKAVTGHSSTSYNDALEISYDFYLDDAFLTTEGVTNFYMFGINLNDSTTLEAFFGEGSGISRQGTAFKVNKETMTITAGGSDTGVKVETGKWYNVTYYIDAHGNRIDFYLDGVLIGKALAQGTVVRDLDKQVVYPLAPYSNDTGAYNSVAYFSNATFNADRAYSFAPTVSAVADDEADTLTITLRDIDPADATVYFFMNGAKFPTAIPFTSETYVLEGLSGYADIKVAVVGEDGEVEKGIFNDDLTSFTFKMTDVETTDVVSNGVITDTGATFTLIKRNIPDQYFAEPISIITINADGEIAVTPYTFAEGVEYDLVELTGEGIEKVFVWNLADLKALDEAITR